jgi:hypothetical protein
MANRARGRILRITPRQAATFIRLELDSQDPRPKDDYFELALEHKNYNSLYSLVLAAAVNRWPITVVATDEITSSREARVGYINVDWKEGQSD